MLDRKGFDQWAGDYDQSISRDEKGYPFEGYYNVLGFVHSRMKVSGDKRILDLGVGTGLLTCELYKQGGRITGVDFSSKMLELAQKKMPEATFYQYDFSQGLPAELKKQKFDYIVSSYAIHHIDDATKIKFVRKLIDCLAEGGKILIADIAFETVQAQEQCKAAAGKFWDSDEFYFNAEEFVPALKKVGLRIQYTQVSGCAGVLEISL